MEKYNAEMKTTWKCLESENFMEELRFKHIPKLPLRAIDQEKNSNVDVFEPQWTFVLTLYFGRCFFKAIESYKDDVLSVFKI